MITLKSHGTYSKTEMYLKKAANNSFYHSLSKYGEMGVKALQEATPKETGLTSESWSYRIEETGNSVRIIWTNSNRNKGVPIALILQYGHGTGTGGWVEGRDYINPAMQPVFDQIEREVWKEVTSS